MEPNAHNNAVWSCGAVSQKNPNDNNNNIIKKITIIKK